MTVFSIRLGTMIVNILHRDRLAILALFILLSSSACTTKIHIPKGSDKYPAIIVLHTSGGLSSHTKQFASRLASDGYVAVAVDYFTQGGTDNIDTAYDMLVQHPRVKRDSIGLVGFSKGATQAIRFAYRSHRFEDRRIKAIVSYYGGPWIPQYSSEYFPSILLLHGDQDVHVPSSTVEQFCEFQTEIGLLCEAVIYPGVRHAFDRHTVKYNGYNSAAKKDAYKQTLRFLAEHLE